MGEAVEAGFNLWIGQWRIAIDSGQRHKCQVTPCFVANRAIVSRNRRAAPTFTDCTESVVAGMWLGVTGHRSPVLPAWNGHHVAAVRRDHKRGSATPEVDVMIAPGFAIRFAVGHRSTRGIFRQSPDNHGGSGPDSPIATPAWPDKPDGTPLQQRYEIATQPLELDS